MFESVLIARFDRLPGHGKIVRREYAIQETHLKLEIDRSLSFESSFLPGRQLDMSMIFKASGDWSKNTCPGCHTASYVTSDSGIKWYSYFSPAIVELRVLTIHSHKCGTWYQRMTELESPLSCDDGLESIEDVPDRREGASEDQQSQEHTASAHRTQKRKVGEAAFSDDDVRAFRRVRLLCPSQPSSESPSHWRAPFISEEMTPDEDETGDNEIDHDIHYDNRHEDDDDDISFISTDSED
ncbi:MAG: hypothetical protein CL912_31985 [Deltaproteobacteria bacterium]|nr:hypothetical protein [Deltaproteobacteria bacterium]